MVEKRERGRRRKGHCDVVGMQRHSDKSKGRQDQNSITIWSIIRQSPVSVHKYVKEFLLYERTARTQLRPTLIQERYNQARVSPSSV